MTTIPIHLLSLAALHAAAPGVLDVVFGPDGDFDGAPDWRPPLACEDDWATDYRITDGACWVYKGPYGNTVQWLVDFDCRVPSVAARLAGLCARAMGEPHGDGWVVTLNGDWCLQSPRGSRAFNWYGNGRPYDALGVLPSAPIVASSVAGFLAALTLALAPQIATLGASR